MFQHGQIWERQTRLQHSRIRIVEVTPGQIRYQVFPVSHSSFTYPKQRAAAEHCVREGMWRLIDLLPEGF